jgi:hypothetical protein
LGTLRKPGLETSINIGEGDYKGLEILIVSDQKASQNAKSSLNRAQRKDFEVLGSRWLV